MLIFSILMMTIMGILVITISVASFYYRTNTSAMTGMMAAMGIGMLVSLTMGVYLGGILQGSLLIATIYSMGIGMIAGFLVGIHSSPLAVLDGILAGVMGGMMGAMLGAMLPIRDVILLNKLLLCISVSVTVMILVLLSPSEQRNERASMKWLTLPILTFLLLLYILISIDPFIVALSSEHCLHGANHSGIERLYDLD